MGFGVVMRMLTRSATSPSSTPLTSSTVPRAVVRGAGRGACVCEATEVGRTVKWGKRSRKGYEMSGEVLKMELGLGT